MKICYGDGPTKFGPGVSISLTGNEVAEAIHDWLVGKGVDINGPRTIKVNDDLCSSGSVYVDPSGSVTYAGAKISGRGLNKSSVESVMSCDDKEETGEIYDDVVKRSQGAATREQDLVRRYSNAKNLIFGIRCDEKFDIDTDTISKMFKIYPDACGDFQDGKKEALEALINEISIFIRDIMRSAEFRLMREARQHKIRQRVFED